MIPAGTYFTRLSQNSTEQQFQQFKDDFNLNDCEKDCEKNFAIIPFECNGHISTIIADLRENDTLLSDRLHLFDSELHHANNVLSPTKDNLKDYFGGLIKEENVFCEYKIQAIGNCAWLTIAFTEECSKLNNFEEIKEQMENGKLLVNTINRTSGLMQENLVSLLTFNEDGTITLNENISKSKAMNISNLCSEFK